MVYKILALLLQSNLTTIHNFMNNNTPFTQSISLKDMGIENAKIHYQLSANELHDMTIASGQGIETSTGALAINTGEYTGRSLWIDLSLKTVLLNQVWWGKVNIPLNLQLLKHCTKK
jgi:phosphoenolpyruvate carboxykinase (ATP)